jgi:hypothetical protein
MWAPAGHSMTNYYSPEERCREITLEKADSPDLVETVKSDLISGKWVLENEFFGLTNSKSTKTAFYFYNYGMADLVNFDTENGIQLNSYLWRIEKYGKEAFLVLTSKEEMSEKLFKVNQNCTGIELTNAINGDRVTLVYKRIMEKDAIKSIKTSLSGNWDCMTYPFDITRNSETCGTFEQMDGAYLKYKFNPDGTYTKNLGTSHLDIEEQGFWEVSEDGQYIIFHAAKRGNANEVFATYVAEVSHLNYGEMVLKQALHGNGEFDTLFCTQIKTFFFNKG